MNSAPAFGSHASRNPIFVSRACRLAHPARHHGGAPFTVDDVAAALVDKLVRRNPHVFGDARAETLEEIEAQWQAIKAQEKAAQAARHP